MGLNEDFKEFIALLNANGVKYLVVGGYAVAFHGHPRYTKDLDFWIWADPDNAERLIKTLRDFGFSELGLQPSDFLNTKNIVQLGHPPNRIDLIAEVSGLDFESAYQNRTEGVFEGVPINFISIEDLIKNKSETGRLSDLADVERLTKRKKK
jgi:hypothetical protein